jgi:uncharacterized protein YbjT (DUF2867 family)
MTILVTGATGNVGRIVVERLVEAGERVRVITRRPETAVFPAGVEVGYGDLTDPATPPGRWSTGRNGRACGGSWCCPQAP